MSGLVGAMVSSHAVPVEACLKAKHPEIYAFLLGMSLLALVSFGILLDRQYQ